MSGGAYDYAEFKLEDMAEVIAAGQTREDRGLGPQLDDELTPTRRRVAATLRIVAQMVHEIEWADSGDTSKEDAAIEIEKLYEKLYEELRRT